MQTSCEIELLRCAAGKPAPPEGLRALCARADWDALLQGADFHGLTLLLGHMLGAAAPARLNQVCAENIVRSLFFVSELKTLLNAFEAAGISVVALKGPALAEMLYADPALRPCSDLDFLVMPDRIDDALRVLAAQGYRLAPHFNGLSATTLQMIDCEVRLRGPRIDVDLHWAIAPPGHILSFDPALLWRERRVETRFPVLSPEATLLFLCAHGAKHAWSRLIWLSDVARLASTEIDWELALSLAAEARCAPAMLLGALLANDVLAARIPAAVCRRARGNGRIAALVETTRVRLLSVASREPSSLLLTSYNVTLAPSALHKLRQYATLIRAPTEAELQTLRLPPNLFFLYYPLRVARLFAKFAGRPLRNS